MSEAHVFCTDSTGDPFGCYCTHCGVFQKIAAPIAIPAYLELIATFGEQHQGCQPLPNAGVLLLKSRAEAAAKAGR